MTTQVTEDKIYADVRMPELESIIKGGSNVQDLHADDGTLVFKYSNNGTETLTAMVDQVGSDRIRALLLFNIPDKKSMACTAAATAWNGETASHGTTAYISKVGETPVIVLESDLLLTGGVTEGNLKAWFDNFVQNINPFAVNLGKFIASTEEDHNDKKAEKSVWKDLLLASVPNLIGLASSLVNVANKAKRSQG